MNPRPLAPKARIIPLDQAPLRFCGPCVSLCVKLRVGGSEKKKTWTTPAGFEPTRAEPSRFRICRLNHSAKVPGAGPVLFTSHRCQLSHSQLHGACVAKWIRRAPPKGKIVGSSPIVGRSIFLLETSSLLVFLRAAKNPQSVVKREHGGIEPPTSRTRSENHTTRPMLRLKKSCRAFTLCVVKTQRVLS